MLDVSNSSAWETLSEDEPPLCIALRRPVSPPRHYEAVNRCGGAHAMSPVNGLVFLNDSELLSVGQDANIKHWKINLI
ncbi:hypothetical protein RB195_022204 [Necator americanus]|uniref:Uncharacterized protein n=1 Tax=Necator americanus TaxID=51031 RepID=A0ABR1EEC4_NECAM